jgi:tRNA A-37 threonylcarbamoyl transferase component Bud32
MKISSWWQWLWTRVSAKRWREARRLTSGSGGEDTTKLLGSGDESTVPEADEGSEQEVWLDELIAQCADGLRVSEVGGDEFWRIVEGLWTQGDELLAGQWIEKFLMLESLDASVVLELRLRLVGMFDQRGDLLPVMSHLDELTGLPEHAVEAHFKLAEHYRRRGEEVQALREYEAVLARDVDYPNVRQRYERLRAQRGELGTVSSSETIVGAGSGSASEGNRYLLVRELGRGAAGVAYLARDMQLEREVAVKLLHPHLAAADQQNALRMFFDEARVAASLRHPNIVAILDLDVKARRIVMELCDGGTLRAVLRDRGPRPLRRALERHAQILSALDAAHARGVVHRDLKPANLMFRRDPDKPGAEVVLGDFGIAHLPNAEGLKGGERAVEDRAVGTMAYMSPEQRRGEVTEKSDIYASAVVLFEMLTGRYPWSREQLLAGTRRPGDFALPASLREEQPQLGAMLQAHLDALGDPVAANRPETTMAMKESRRLRDLAMIACAGGDPSL